ncbi:MAG: glucosidase, partial [Chlamydiae bacterium]|nr:glucosidase [Chlamydiota bacterium]
MDAEKSRLQEEHVRQSYWKKWGPYLAERQWGTVREDFSSDGNAWDYLNFYQSHSRAYRFGEDGIAGICDTHEQLCFALAFWNGKDPLLKEKLFGLSNTQGNHGEDVKEYYYYLDNTPTHSYMKYLYKYPQPPFPYEALTTENAKRDQKQREYELLDTGVFQEDRYFDIFIEYAKATPHDIYIYVTIHNRGPDKALCHVL